MVCPRCSVTHSNSAAFISKSCNTVAMCFLIFEDVISSGFLRTALWAISCTTSQPRTCLRDLLVVHGNKYTLLSGILIFLRLSSKISITSCTLGVKIVGMRFFLFPLEYISSKRVANSFSRGSSKLSTSSCLFQSLRFFHCSIVNFAASLPRRALKVIILIRTSF